MVLLEERVGQLKLSCIQTSGTSARGKKKKKKRHVFACLLPTCVFTAGVKD